MNTSDTSDGGWANTKMRKDLNGYSTLAEVQDVELGGLGNKLSNKEYIKQVKKQYVKIRNEDCRFRKSMI